MVVTYERIEVGADAPSVVGRVYDSSSTFGGIAPLAVWGTSYAISTERAELKYNARGRAAANVYDGKRITQVCFWYTRGTTQISNKKCSNAVSSGGWSSGPEVTDTVWDSINPVAPKTYFNISTVRIDPNIY